MRHDARFRIRLPLRWLSAFLVVSFVLFSIAIFIYISLNGLQRLTEERAVATFTALAEQDVQKIQQLLGSATTIVQGNARLPAHILLNGEQLNIALLTERLIADLRSKPGLHGAFIGMANGESLRVLAIRKDPVKEAALGAPTGTFWAVQYIPAAVDGAANSRWQFWTEFRETVTYSPLGTDYSAIERPWWQRAWKQAGLQVAGPYFFLEMQALGMTLSQNLAHGDGVIGMAVSLQSINDTLQASLHNHQGGIVVIDSEGRAVGSYASHDYLQPALASLEQVSASDNPFYAAATKLSTPDSSELVMTKEGPFVYVRRDVSLVDTTTLHVVAFSPVEAYAGPLYEARGQLLGFSAVLLILMVPMAFWAGRRLTRPIEALIAESVRMQAMDFSDGEQVRSHIAEVDTLGQTHQLMKTAVRERTESLNQALSKLKYLADAGIQLATEHQEKPLIYKAVNYAVPLLDAQAGQYWHFDEAQGFRLIASTGLPHNNGKIAHKIDLSLNDPCNEVMRLRTAVRLNAANMHQLDMSLQHRLLGQLPASLLAVPVMQREQFSGVLLLCNSTDLKGQVTEFTETQERYATTLAAQTAVTLQNIALQKAQAAMMDALIKMIAGAIDAKSPYTGGHCNRVPELALLLLDAANKQTQGPFADFNLENEDELREFRIGAWLHDCGKVTTPEYVVDKATKLEIIYNRIHEIRMRFEVLLRDADIERLRAVANGADAEAENQRYNEKLLQLQDDFAFIASCNIGGEFMADKDIARLQAISKQTWWRHFNDRLGLSHPELNQIQHIPEQPLPACEQLLADKAEHIIPRTQIERYDERYGFRIDIPDNLYNFGELYNLSIQRGTLSPEERFKINEHIMQTIVMLEQLPLPDSLKRVPEYAGTHHETMIGTGYPRRLKSDQLSVPARIMAVADIFEALTASDRPYKKAKSLSEAVKILFLFKQDGHIDPDLFELFLKSGVYLEYAHRYLDDSQIDEVDVNSYLT